MRKGRHDNHEINLIPPGMTEVKKHWVQIDDIADGVLTDDPVTSSELNKKNLLSKEKRKRLINKYYIPLTIDDHLHTFAARGYQIKYNPPGDGNCQFEALCYHLHKCSPHMTSPQKGVKMGSDGDIFYLKKET